VISRRQPGRSAAAAVALAVAAVLTGATAARAQQEGPVVIGTKAQTNWLTLQPTRAELELLYRQQNDEITPNNGPKQKFREDRFEENFTLGGVGSIYHPNLVALDLTGTFGLFQSELDNLGEQDHENGTLYEWDASAVMLRKEDVVPTLYSRRNRQIISRQFGPSFDSTITTTGAVLDIRKKTLPTRLEVYHTDEEQAAVDNTGDFNLSQDTFTWHTEHRPSQQQVYTWDYTYNNISQSTGNVHTDFQTHDATLSHSIDFGPKDKNNLSSSLHYFNQSGDFEVRQFRWDELLRLRHTDTFETRYRYTFDQQSYSNTDQTTNRAQVGFTHRLYKSLVTNGNIGVESIERSDGADSFQTFGDIDFDYRKQVPLGQLTLNAGVGFSRQTNDAIHNTVTVFDQPQTFSDAVPIILVGNNINPNSIVVTDPSGLLIYLNGVDYTVGAFPNRVEITRVVGGRIGEGQTVLVDYSLSPQPSNTTDTNFFYFGGRYDIERGPLKGLGVYARYAKQDQSVSSSDPSAFTPNSYTDILVGGDYKFWLVTVGAEQQWHDSTIVPFDATRFFARFSTPVGTDTLLSLNSAYDIIRYTDTENRVTLFTVSAQAEHRFSRRLWGIATVLWRDERDEQNGDSTGLEEQLELQWRHRQTFIYGTLRNANLQSDFQDNSFRFIEVGVRRQF
jgi:hypothetical protein